MQTKHAADDVCLMRRLVLLDVVVRVALVGPTGPLDAAQAPLASLEAALMTLCQSQHLEALEALQVVWVGSQTGVVAVTLVEGEALAAATVVVVAIASCQAEAVQGAA